MERVNSLLPNLLSFNPPRFKPWETRVLRDGMALPRELRRYLAVLSLPAGAPTYAQVVGYVFYTIVHSLKAMCPFLP